MVLSSRDWGLEDTKKWFEVQCRYEFSLSEKAWDLVIVPLFNDLEYKGGQVTELQAKLKYTEELAIKEAETTAKLFEELKTLRKQLADTERALYEEKAKLKAIYTQPNTYPTFTLFGDGNKTVSTNPIGIKLSTTNEFNDAFLGISPVTGIKNDTNNINLEDLKEIAAKEINEYNAKFNRAIKDNKEKDK